MRLFSPSTSVNPCPLIVFRKYQLDIADSFNTQAHPLVSRCDTRRGHAAHQPYMSAMVQAIVISNVTFSPTRTPIISGKESISYVYNRDWHRYSESILSPFKNSISSQRTFSREHPLYQPEKRPKPPLPQRAVFTVGHALQAPSNHLLRYRAVRNQAFVFSDTIVQTAFAALHAAPNKRFLLLSGLSGTEAHGLLLQLPEAASKHGSQSTEHMPRWLYLRTGEIRALC